MENKVFGPFLKDAAYLEACRLKYSEGKCCHIGILNGEFFVFIDEDVV